MCKTRFCFVLGLMVIMAVVLCWRLFNIQVLSSGEWSAQAYGQQRYFAQDEGERGTIYLQNTSERKVPIAVNRRITHVYISPREIKSEEKKEIALALSNALEVDEEEVMIRMERDTSYEVIKRDISEEEIKEIKKLPKVYLESEVKRHYPESDFASHIIGFIGGEGLGQYGVEQYYENILRGRGGIREGSRNSWGLFITRDSTERGDDVFLTVDYNIQHFIEKSLLEAHDDFNITGGSILVGDPNDGKILGMANFPSFDPNNFSETSDYKIFKNSSIQETFEPGSIFKPITMAAALEERAIDPDETYNDTGEERVHGRVIRNYGQRAYGEVTMREIMEKSINTGIVHVKDRIGNDVFEEYIKKFGFFDFTEIDLHGEVIAENRSFKEGYDINYATASFGQGIEITPIQFFRAFSAIANGGVMVNPYIVQGMKGSEGERVISPSTSSQMTSILVGTIEDGFGGSAKVPGYHVAGKTGTSQISWSDLGINQRGYSDQTIQAFAGYVPAYDPQFLIIIKLDQPQARTAEVSAAPIFRKVADYTLQYKQIPPDYKIENEKNN